MIHRLRAAPVWRAGAFAGALVLATAVGVRVWRRAAPTAERNVGMYAALSLRPGVLQSLECIPSDFVHLAPRNGSGMMEWVTVAMAGPERLCLSPSTGTADWPRVSIRLTRLGDVYWATRRWTVPDSQAAVAFRDSIIGRRLRTVGERHALCRASSTLERTYLVEPDLSILVSALPYRPMAAVPTEQRALLGYLVEVTALRGEFACPETRRGTLRLRGARASRERA